MDTQGAPTYVLAVALGTILFALNQSVIVTPIDDMHHCMKIRACLDVLNMSAKL